MFLEAKYQGKRVFFEADTSFLYQSEEMEVLVTLDSVTESLQVVSVPLRELSEIQTEQVRK